MKTQMSETATVYVSLAVEGDVDASVAARLVREAGASVHNVYGKNGEHHLRRLLAGYNEAAKFSPWLFLVDLDSDFDCAPLLRGDWLPAPAPRMLFRVAVREIEAWLMADAETIASFLGISRTSVPENVEALVDAKRTLVDLAARSRYKRIREDLVPRLASGRSTGPAYSSRMIQYAETAWRPSVAAANSPSLAKSMARIAQLCAT